jgi:hypothetical protein
MITKLCQWRSISFALVCQHFACYLSKNRLNREATVLNIFHKKYSLPAKDV